ncbi:hypothetical protein [Tepidibacter formicigenes]|jgi:hypothetical protein|uniref:Two-component signal transduction system YycFG, regulatory protein YycH n=1 Tax=Tepidibacter formicigenes DSM 15518 TaxID=1123349 RepID=A0A1M6NKA0_9FIRM|nr:hypothetical protein [Tepidibacter formicigenes]SHJ96096.1 hypothetical protein SAMN02744037_01291 [Tepidibacter formicigenes DSM 15518]
MNREKFKTLILIFLFLTSNILLLLNISLIGFSLDLKKMYESNVSLGESLDFILKPERIYIHFGGGNNTEILKNKDEYWSEAKLTLKETLIKEADLKEISYMEYLFKKDIKSIELKFNKGINGNILNKSMFLKKSSITKLGDILEILIPLVDDKAIYFLNSENKVYKVEVDNLKSINLVDELEKGNYIKYYTVNYMFDINNHTLFPLEMNLSYPMIKSKNNFDIYNDKEIQDLGKKFLNEKYDFANRIVETNGNNTFIYGYGEKVLRIYSNGYIEYLNENTTDKDLTIEQALNIALDFLRKHSIDWKKLNLSSIHKEVIKNKKAYRFSFYYKIKDLKLETNALNAPIQITVIGEDVYSYKAFAKNMDYILNDNSRNNIIPPQEILNMNFSLLQKDNNYLNGSDIWENIKDVELIYFLKDDKFIPAWKFYIGNKIYVFDAYKGENL